MFTFLLKEERGKSRLSLHLFCPQSQDETQAELVEESYGKGLGWYVVKRIQLDRNAFQALKLALPDKKLSSGIPGSISGPIPFGESA